MPLGAPLLEKMAGSMPGALLEALVARGAREGRAVGFILLFDEQKRSATAASNLDQCGAELNQFDAFQKDVAGF